ncbi:hypothetical protein, conserved [Eimeria acervulina]|uniref:Glutaredoxin domain-containing protein n=1 Tax=Eimeria acervulina TaxID=5801 RepID=U6GNZ9_EIMAC|nr:hypothetical protein, conserved [Eimeria acervulina]CDI80334.1 hypothetical protein, conserved [Eimeria acervulina]
MKGRPESPLCGFSSRAVQLLEAAGTEEYTFVDCSVPQVQQLQQQLQQLQQQLQQQQQQEQQQQQQPQTQEKQQQGDQQKEQEQQQQQLVQKLQQQLEQLQQLQQKRQQLRAAVARLFHWATLPLLVVRGKPIGGADIMQQLQQQQQLAAIIRGEQTN